jgi:hypothetical protein
MNFIRNIIAEKRNSKALEVDPPHFAQPGVAIQKPDGNIFSQRVSTTDQQLLDADWDADLDEDDAPETEKPHTVEPVKSDLSYTLPLQASPNRVPSPGPRTGLEAWKSAERQLSGRDAAQAAEARPETQPTMPARNPDEDRRLRHAYLNDQQPKSQRISTAINLEGPLAPVAEPARQPVLHDMPFVEVAHASPSAEYAADPKVEVPAPAGGRGTGRSGRVKTRLLGFNPATLGPTSAFEKDVSPQIEAFPVGWLVVVEGPGLGTPFALHEGVARIGRGDDQTICLNFGDNAISRENHLSIAFDTEQSAFFIGQSGRSNIVRLNKRPLLSTEKVTNGDQIRVGETTLRLVTLCGDDFTWAAKS